MDPLVTMLLNFGGMGTVAAVLLLLHRDAIKAFERQLSKERESSVKLWESFMEIKLRHHEQIVQQLLAQDKMLSKIDDSQARLHDRLNPRP